MTVEIHWPDEDKTVRGKAGQSLLDIAHENGIDVDHACGGVCACSTCHVKIEAGMELLSEQEEDEEDQLDDARDVNLRSRLSCQARILEGAEGRIVVAIPSWNVNLAREAPH
jgi:2Fe-2S ferredoxin